MDKGVTVVKGGRKNQVALSQRAISKGNGEDKGIIGAAKAGLQVLTGLISRMQLANRAGLQFGGLRDLYNVFGYKVRLTPEDFLAKYVRQDIASRIIDAPPDATWSNPPALEGPAGIQEAWDELNDEHDIWGVLNRVDRLSRLNHFSILLFGFDDTSALERPVKKAGQLLYIRAIGARQIHQVDFDTDVRSKRFGLPAIYDLRFDDPSLKSVSAGAITVKGLKQMKVHASRVVHVVEKPLEDTSFGIPIMEKIYNLLDDLLKVGGGTSEMYWLGARSGMQADVDKEMDFDPEDAVALKDELDEYMHQLRRVIRTRGVKLNVLESQVPSPAEIFDMLLGLISGTTGIPRRILLGSEAGELASAQDRANWAERIAERRVLFSEPRVLRPTTNLLQSLGLLPEGKITFEWPSAFIQNPLEIGQTMAQTARAIGNISRQTGAKTPMQLTSREEAREIIGLEGDLDESDIIDITDPDDSQAPQTRPGAEDDESTTAQRPAQGE